jgi:hypothetical protein
MCILSILLVLRVLLFHLKNNKVNLDENLMPPYFGNQNISSSKFPSDGRRSTKMEDYRTTQITLTLQSFFFCGSNLYNKIGKVIFISNFFHDEYISIWNFECVFLHFMLNPYNLLIVHEPKLDHTINKTIKCNEYWLTDYFCNIYIR